MFGIGTWESLILGVLCCVGPLVVAGIVTAVVVFTKKPPP